MLVLRQPALRAARGAAAASSTRAYTSTIDASRMTVVRTTAPKPRPAKETLVFGQTTTDHMLEVDWGAEAGWSAPSLTPYHALALDPACNVFHYGIEAFEGAEAYVDAKGGLRLFRPEMNMARLAKSMRTLALPPLDEAGFLECVRALVRADADWVPRGEGFALYLRPTVIGTQPTLGVSRSRRCKLFVIACPVGPYYPEGFKPVRLLAERDHVRAWPGGTGDSKLGGNYAPSIRVQGEAQKAGFAQVLWLFGAEQQVTEVSTMKLSQRGHTPPLQQRRVPPLIDAPSLQLRVSVRRARVTRTFARSAFNEILHNRACPALNSPARLAARGARATG